MAKSYVSTTINGEAAEYLCEPQQTLLDVLRDVVGLTGAKEGCASGDCGACSVLIDGVLVCSCLVLGVEADGASVTTIEGIADGEKLHPVQQKFLEHAALQCGFCTPGLIVATKALLDSKMCIRDSSGTAKVVLSSHRRTPTGIASAALRAARWAR